MRGLIAFLAYAALGTKTLFGCRDHAPLLLIYNQLLPTKIFFFHSMLLYYFAARNDEKDYFLDF